MSGIDEQVEAAGRNPLGLGRRSGTSPESSSRPWGSRVDSELKMESVRLTIVPNEAEAEILCGMLRDRNIKCGYRKSDMAGAWTVGFAAGGPTEVLVAEADLPAAKKLVAEL